MYTALRIACCFSLAAGLCIRVGAADVAASAPEVTASATLEHPDSLGIYGLAFAGGGESLFTSAGKLWDVKTGKAKAEPAFKAYDAAMATSPDGKLVAVAETGPAVHVVDAATGKSVQDFRHDEGGFGGTTLGWSPDSKRLVSTRDKMVRIWDIGGAKDPVAFDTRGAGRAAAFSPDGSRVAICLWAPGAIVLADAKTGKVVKEMALQASMPNWVYYQSDKTLVVPSDKGADLLDIESGKLKELVRTDGNTGNAALSADGKLLALGPATTGDGSGPITVWNISTAKQVATLKGHSGKVYPLAFSPDGKFLASGSADKTARLWPMPKP